MIGGRNGVGKADKLIGRVFLTIMSAELLSTYTWSGRGKGEEKKNSFKNYRNVQQLIFTVLNLVQKTYSLDECIHHIKFKVLKYAYLHSKKEIESKDNSNDLETLDPIVINDSVLFDNPCDS